MNRSYQAEGIEVFVPTAKQSQRFKGRNKKKPIFQRPPTVSRSSTEFEKKPLFFIWSEQNKKIGFLHTLYYTKLFQHT